MADLLSRPGTRPIPADKARQGEFNRMANDRLGTPKELVIVEDAGHLFEEPGTLAEAERLVARWFRLHLAAEREL